MIGTLKNHVVQTVGVLLVTLVILLNCCPRGFCQTETSTEIGEALTIAGGIGIAIVGMLVSVPPVSYAGLCVLGLGVVSIFWR